MKSMRVVWPLFLLLVVGCAETVKQSESGPAGTSTATAEQKIESQPLKCHLKNRNIKPQPTRALNAQCQVRARTGSET